MLKWSGYRIQTKAMLISKQLKREVSIQYRNKKEEYLKAKID